MNVFLWIVAGLLALGFLGAGAMKLSQPREKLRANMAWVEDFSAPMVKFIGAMEVLGALGLILPAATGIAPILTPVAAVGLAVIMLGAIVTHAKRKEYPMIGINAVLLILAVVVAWGRFGAYAI